MTLDRIVLGCLLLIAAALGCKSQDQAAAVAPAEKVTIAGPQAGVLPAPADVAAAPDGAERTGSGLACIVLRKGTGTEHPGIYDTVEMNQVVWTTDGKMQMNTGDRGAPVEFDVTQSVLPGLREAIELMVEGEKRRCWIPGRLAFGEAGAAAPGGGKPLGTLVYDLDLVALKKATNLPQAPADVAAVPADAERSDSGLAWRVLKEGSGDKRPQPNSVVTLLYTGWTPDGEVFMTTGRQGLPKSSAMTSVLPGWREGLQLMRLGEKRRFWIPEDLAYRGQPGRPQGPVVFDIELAAFAP
jgi:FKBP-type peptidyl-prolyl cis-trans isomerase